MTRVRTRDGSAGDADYGRIGAGYRTYRQPEPEFQAAIELALGAARLVLNVGAGAGSYEPGDREVTAVEPSAAMRAQRPASLSAAIDATAEDLPFADDSFDAAMATFTVHQWSNLAAGLAELRRVSRGPVVILTCDPALVTRFWLYRYAPAVLDTEARRYPSIDRIAAGLGGTVSCTNLPIPFGCVDGFGEAYYGRPEMLLDPGARLANSAWSFVDDGTATAYAAALRSAVADGSWDRAYGRLRRQAHFEGSLVLVVAQPTRPVAIGRPAAR